MKTHGELRVEGDVAHLVLTPDPPGKPPVLGHALFSELTEAAGRIRALGNDLRAVILSSASPRHFLVGADINVLAGFSAETVGDWVRAGHEAFNAIEDLPMPVLARVEGNALGGGLELAMICDFILAGPRARFGQPEVGLGVITGHGGAWRLERRIGYGPARQLLFTGKIIEGTEAAAIGLCDFLGTEAELDAWIEHFLDTIRSASAASIAETKALLLRFHAADRERACALEVEASERLLGTADTAARIREFLAKRK
jgi:enoyl-CoA hydratase